MLVDTIVIRTNYRIQLNLNNGNIIIFHIKPGDELDGFRLILFSYLTSKMLT